MMKRRGIFCIIAIPQSSRRFAGVFTTVFCIWTTVWMICIVILEERNLIGRSCTNEFYGKKIFTKDLEIAKSLISRNESVTRSYFYGQCYPLFKSIYDNYYTDCKCCKEFMDEVYIIVLSPNKRTGKCKLENFRGESTLTSWLKTVCIYYCYKRYKLSKRLPVYEPLQHTAGQKKDNESDRMYDIYGSVNIDFTNLNYQDAMVILSQMPNKRYSKLIQLRYLESKSNEETAEALGMTMKNYYNKHKLAKEQYEEVCRKEESYG